MLLAQCFSTNEPRVFLWKDTFLSFNSILELMSINRGQGFCGSSKEDHGVWFLEAPYNHMAEVTVVVHGFKKQLSIRRGSVIGLLPSEKFSEPPFLVYVNLNQEKSKGELILVFISPF